MYECERDEDVKNCKFGKWNTITVDKRRDILEMLIYPLKR